MAYRNRTYVAFDSRDIHYYRMMMAWNANENMEFDFYNAHDLNIARDTSSPEQIKRKLRERFSNTKQVVLLGSTNAREKTQDKSSFLAYEVEIMMNLNLPIVIANLDKNRVVAEKNIPRELYGSSHFTVSVSYQPKIIEFALDKYVEEFASSEKAGSCQYGSAIYSRLGM